MTNYARIFGVIFLLLGVLGFFDNPLVGPSGFFLTDTFHNVVHLILGLLLVIPGTYQGSKRSIMIAGALYLILAIAGFFVKGENMFGIVAINGADDWLHIVLAILLLGGSYFFKQKRMFFK
jgi:hypothetical protein